MAESRLSGFDRAQAIEGLGPLDDVSFGRMQRLFESRYGLEFPERRREILRLHLRDHALGSGWAQFVDRLHGSDGVAELDAIVDSITVHQTEFFRHPSLFDALRHRVVPELAARARTEGRPLQMWSAGCSTGEEPYSLAMLGLAAGGQVAITATDLAPGVLLTAIGGIYDRRAVGGVHPDLRSRYIDDGPGPGKVMASAALRSVVSFSVHNLVRDPPPAGAVDLVMCCNVIIYFSDEAFQSAVHTLFSAVRPGGYLVLGHSESLWRVSHPLEVVDLKGAFAYRRPLPAAKAPVASRVDEVRPASHDRVLPERRPKAAPRARTPVPDVPSRVELPELVAEAHGLLERDHQAELDDLLRKGQVAFPSAADLHLLCGLLRQRQGRFDEAMASFGRAIYCEAACSLAWFHRAATLDRIGDQRAATDYDTAARLLARDDPRRWDGYLESMGHRALIRHCQERSAALAPAPMVR